MKGDEQQEIEFDDKVARALRRPLRHVAVPPFDRVRQRANRRRPAIVAVPTAVAVIVLALIVGGALAERRAPGKSTPQPAAVWEAAAWQTVRRTLPASGPIAVPSWLPPSIDRATIEIRELTAERYVIAYRGDEGRTLVFAMGSSPGPSAGTEAQVSIRGVRRSPATLSLPQSVFSDRSAKGLRRIEWKEGDRWLRIESESLSGDDLVRVAWSLDLATAPPPAHAFTRDLTGTCASSDPEGTLRTFLALAGRGDGNTALDCYALVLIEVVGPSLGQGWANLPKATLVSLQRRPDSGGRAQLLVSWTFASDPGGAWGSPATMFFLLAREDGVYRIAEMATAPLGPHP
jgi:hypothetical protein